MILTKTPEGRKRRAETTRKTRRKVCKTEESAIDGKIVKSKIILDKKD